MRPKEELMEDLEIHVNERFLELAEAAKLTQEEIEWLWEHVYIRVIGPEEANDTNSSD